MTARRAGALPAQIRRRSFLRVLFGTSDLSVGKIDDAVGHARDRNVVRNDHGRRAQVAIDRGQCIQHQDAGLIVQRAGRFIAQQQRRPLGDGSRDGYTLLFTTRQLGRKMVDSIAQTNAGQRLGGVHGIVGDVGH